MNWVLASINECKESSAREYWNRERGGGDNLKYAHRLNFGFCYDEKINSHAHIQYTHKLIFSWSKNKQTNWKSATHNVCYVTIPVFMHFIELITEA